MRLFTHTLPTRAAIVLAFFALFQGCTAFQTYPHKASGGDTVTVAVGSPEGMTKDNTSVYYVSDSDLSNPIDITAGLKAVFKLYPDKLSTAWQNSSAGGIEVDSGHGPWLSVIAIDLPTGVLPVGPGSLQVTTGGYYSPNTTNVQDVSVALEILSSTGGEPNPFDYAYSGVTAGNLADLEPRKHVAVKPNFFSVGSYPRYGAVEVKLNMPSSEALFSENIMKLVIDDKTSHAANPVQYGWTNVGDSITVYFINPKGLRYFDVQFAIAPGLSGATLTSVKYYDLDGVETAGPILDVTLVQ